MQVQPYFPEQESVLDNVANAPYDERLVFVRRVLLGLCFSLGVIRLFAGVRFPISQVQALYLLLLGSLILSATRRLTGGGRWDQITSVIFGIPWLALAGYWLGSLKWLPSEFVFIAAFLLIAYGLLCGRDYSFVAQFFLSFLGLVLVGLGGVGLGKWNWGEFGVGCIVGGVVQCYIVYDLAALLNRRRRGEEIAAVVDFYRDFLNILTYSLRVVQHWRNFKI